MPAQSSDALPGWIFDVDARAEMTGGVWVVRLAGLEVAFTVGSVSMIRRAALKAAATHFGVEQNRVRVKVDIVLPPGLAEEWAHALEREADARAAVAEAADVRRDVVQGLKAEGFSVTDMGAMLGLSPSRIYQLLSTTKNTATDR